MLTAIANISNSPHEVVESFQAIGFPLNRKLESMLNEDLEHQRPRRGSGFTQASRHLAEFINQPRVFTNEFDLRIFSEAGQNNLKRLIAIFRTSLGRKPKGLYDLLTNFMDANTSEHDDFVKLQKLANLTSTFKFEESQLIGNMILSILGVHCDKEYVNSKHPLLPPLDEKPAIGTCPEAERYFLEFAGGYLRRHGLINIFTDEHNRPIVVEKIGIGDSHSCITIADTWINNVQIPAGSLLGTRYSTVPIDAKPCAELNGAWMPLPVSHGFRFLRLTTLAVSPENRERAFNNHVKKQLEGSPFFDPLNTTIADLKKIAQRQCPYM